eukprot:80646_1
MAYHLTKVTQRLLFILIFLVILVNWVSLSNIRNPYAIFNTTPTLLLSAMEYEMYDHAMDFGIILFAYSKDEHQCIQYLNETYSLCSDLLSKNVHPSYRLNISLFTMETHYMNYIRNDFPSNCVLDHVLFVDKLILDHHDNNTRLTWKEFDTRIQLLSYSPYYITMSLDADFYPCYALNVVQLYTQMVDKDIDFAFTSFKTDRIPQGGLFIYQKNNKTKYLFDEWHKHHTQQLTTNKTIWKNIDDQQSLHETIGNVLGKMNIYLLNNRYNYRGFGFSKKWNYHSQLLYPNNKIIMFHRRPYTSYYYDSPEEICAILNRYSDRLTMVYDDYGHGNVLNCFNDSEPKCWDYLGQHRRFRKPFKHFWSDEYHCQWNERIDFVPYDQDTCG